MARAMPPLWVSRSLYRERVLQRAHMSCSHPPLQVVDNSVCLRIKPFAHADVLELRSAKTFADGADAARVCTHTPAHTHTRTRTHQAEELRTAQVFHHTTSEGRFTDDSHLYRLQCFATPVSTNDMTSSAEWVGARSRPSVTSRCSSLLRSLSTKIKHLKTIHLHHSTSPLFNGAIQLHHSTALTGNGLQGLAQHVAAVG